MSQASPIPANSASSSSSPSTSAPATSANGLPIIRVGGVPEHFNLPWFQASDADLYTKNGVSFQWVECKLGTGEMINALKAGTVDIIVALTEGLISDIALGSDLRLIGTYVESPLNWAISTGPDSAVHEIADLKGGTIGISRYTSGSHLMSCVLASQRGWQQSDLKYSVEGSFANLRESVRSQRTAAFMWEHFTTKPFHDSKEVRRIGEICTPWPCFHIASRADFLADPIKRAGIQAVLRSIQQSCRNFSTTPLDKIVPIIAKQYNLKEADALAWYKGVTITGSTTIHESTFTTVLQALKDAAILTSTNYPIEKPLKDFIDPTIAHIESDLKSMRLYSKPELLTALYNNIRVRLQKEKGALTEQELQKYDQNHYNGTTAVDICIKECALTAESRVLQLGSSVGGPSRYIASQTQCEVLGIELQNDLHEAAEELTQRCGLDTRVTHLCGNFMTLSKYLEKGVYDCIPSWLTVLHFDRLERRDLFERCFTLLKEGGRMFIEDFYQVSPFTQAELLSLRNDVYCKYLPTKDNYIEALKLAGFTVEAHDLTQEWREYTQKRYQSWIDAAAENTAIHGEEIVKGLTYFYERIKLLFEGGNCGGVRIIARKPVRTEEWM